MRVSWVVATAITLICIILFILFAFTKKSDTALFAPSQGSDTASFKPSQVVVIISATYPGASCKVLDENVGRIIESQIDGVEDISCYKSKCNDRGFYNCYCVFKPGVSSDVALVKIQDAVRRAEIELPAEVKSIGVDIKIKGDKIAVYTFMTDGREGGMDIMELSNYVEKQVADSIARMDGVGLVETGGRTYSMRIWLDQTRLAGLNVSIAEIKSAIESQNVQAAAGTVGGEYASRHLTFKLNVKGRLTSKEEFENIIIRNNPETGGQIRVKDVARVELGCKGYTTRGKFNENTAVSLSVYKSPEADAVETTMRVLQEVDKLIKRLPPGVEGVLLDSILYFSEENTFPANEDCPWITCVLRLSEGQSIDNMIEVVDQVYERAQMIPGIRSVFSTCGSGGIWGKGENLATMQFRLDQWDGYEESGLLRDRIMDKLRISTQDLYTAEIFFYKASPLRGISDFGDVAFNLCSMEGTSVFELYEVAESVMAQLCDHPYVKSVVHSLTVPTPQLKLKLDRQKAELLGITPKVVFQVLQNQLASFYVNDFNIKGGVYEVTLQYDSDHRMSIADILAVRISTASGESVPISSIVTVESSDTSETMRYNGMRAACFYVTLNEGVSSSQFKKVIESLKLPTGYLVSPDECDIGIGCN